MQIFYGAAIQGVAERGARAHVHRALIQHIRSLGHQVFSEHTTGETTEDVVRLMQQVLGPLPEDPQSRRILVREGMLAGVEGAIGAAVFEVSDPSLGTGIELAHAYLRPRLGLAAVPILCLYEQGYWTNKLSSMVSGITREALPMVHLHEYTDLEDARNICIQFFSQLGTAV